MFWKRKITIFSRNEKIFFKETTSYRFFLLKINKEANIRYFESFVKLNSFDKKLKPCNNFVILL